MFPAISQVAGLASKPQRLGFCALMLALCGLVLGFVIDYSPHNPFSFGALSIVILAVAMGLWAELFWSQWSCNDWHNSLIQ